MTRNSRHIRPRTTQSAPGRGRTSAVQKGQGCCPGFQPFHPGVPIEPCSKANRPPDAMCRILRLKSGAASEAWTQAEVLPLRRTALSKGSGLSGPSSSGTGTIGKTWRVLPATQSSPAGGGLPRLTGPGMLPRVSTRGANYPCFQGDSSVTPEDSPQVSSPQTSGTRAASRPSSA